MYFIYLILRRAVLKSEGEEFARENGLTFMETSAKTADGVDPAFLQTAELVYNKMTTGKYLGQGDVSTNPTLQYFSSLYLVSIYLFVSIMLCLTLFTCSC